MENKKKTVINRRLVREFSMKTLYALESQPGSLQETLSLLFQEWWTEKQQYKSFVYEYSNKVYSAQKDIDRLISDISSNWHISRICLVDKIIIRMSIAEFWFFEDVPEKVSINEAVELAKKYSTDRSYGFVNGILDAALKEMKKKNLVKKQGRGLADLPSKKV